MTFDDRYRYDSITLELDPSGPAGSYRLTFSTMPGMSMQVTDLRMADLDALARVLNRRAETARWAKLTASPRGELGEDEQS